MLDVIWALEMQRASAGAFSNPYEVRAMLRAVYWEGRAPDSLKKGDGKPSESEMEQNLAKARELAAALSAARTGPDLADEVESPE